MLDPQKITMGRVREAFGLNNNEVEGVIRALWPDTVFPVELWRRTHEKYWRAFADSNQAVYKLESPALPEIDLSAKYFWPHLCALDVQTFFRKLSLNIQASALREGLHFILEESYEDIDAVFPEEREFLFSTLEQIEKVDIFDQYSPDSELFEGKILSLPASSCHFISYIFSNTVLVDTVAAIRHLYFLNIPFRKEVKGITRALVDSVHKSLTEAAVTVIFTPQPQEQLQARPSTGSRKDIERINATRQVCEQLLEELLQERQAFESDKNTWKPSLLNHTNGKTNWDTFFTIAAKRLGDKPHRDTAREIWKKVPAEYQHPGRMPD